MTLKTQNSFLGGDLRALGVPLLDSTNLLVDPNGAAGNLVYPAGAVQLSTPLTGATVLLTDDASNGTLYVTPAGTIAALTVTLPSEANSKVGEERTIVTSQTITALTVNGATTIHGNVTTLAAGASATFRKLAANIWAKV